MTREVKIADHKCGLRQNKKYVLREDTLLFHEDVKRRIRRNAQASNRGQ